jgi:hypothetical protein
MACFWKLTIDDLQAMNRGHDGGLIRHQTSLDQKCNVYV